MKSEHNPYNILWSKTQHALMKPGGTWTVPRSGLIFTRTDHGFELAMVMPFTDDMGMASAMGRDVPSTPDELLAYQQQDFKCIQRHFRAAKLDITDPKGILGIGGDTKGKI